MKNLLITALVASVAIPSLLLAGTGNRGGHFMDRFDSNKDGTVTKEEINKVRSEEFLKYDKDGNGVLSVDEWKAMREDRLNQRMQRQFTRHDSNNDGAISQEEFMTKPERMMSHLDKNGDNVIDADEMPGHRRGSCNGPKGGHRHMGW